MIKINIEKYCENCPGFDAEQTSSCTTTLDGSIVFVEHIIKCKNEASCKHIRKFLEQYKINEEN